MPQTVTSEKTLYTFDELDDSAKEKARDWYRSCIDDNDFSCEVDEFVTVGEALGIDFDTHNVNLHGGGMRRDPNIYWSLSYTQSDGASFEGTYDYKATAERELRAINNDETWVPLRIAIALAKIQADNAFGLRAAIKSRDGRYIARGVDVVDRRNEDRDVVDAEDQITQCVRDLERYLYDQLRAQNEYLNSDEAVDESIQCNEYTFDEEGNRDG